MENESSAVPAQKSDGPASASFGQGKATPAVTSTWGAPADFRNAPPDLSGTTLGDYRLVRLIARGGMGEVYEAVQLNLDRTVAIKLLAPQFAANPEFRQRFEREAKAAAALTHPNVVQVHDFGKVEDRYFLVMELVRGEDLSSHMGRVGKLPLDQVLGIVEQVIRALKAAAEHSIIHRDIKPANLMLTADGFIKLADLGLAKKVTDSSELTLTGAAIGSPHFLAPEQADDASTVDHRADIYSLGITMLFLLTGKRPFDGSSAFSIVLSHANKPLPTGRELGTELPDCVEELIQRMTEKDPEDRYPDYDALWAGLQQVRSELANPKTSPSLGLAVRTDLRQNLQTVRPVPTRTRIISSIDIPEDRPRRALSARYLIIGVAATMLLLAGFFAAQLRSSKTTESATSSLEPREPIGFPPPPGPGHGPHFPILPPPEPLEPPIPDGPIDEMFKAAKSFADENPTKYRDVLVRFHQVRSKASGSPLAAEIDRLMVTWEQKKSVAVEAAIVEFQAKMGRFIQAGNPSAALESWRSFPSQLRSWETDRRIDEIVRLATGLPERRTPHDRGPHSGPPPDRQPPAHLRQD